MTKTTLALGLLATTAALAAPAWDRVIAVMSVPSSTR